MAVDKGRVGCSGGCFLLLGGVSCRFSFSLCFGGVVVKVARKNRGMYINS